VKDTDTAAEREAATTELRVVERRNERTRAETIINLATEHGFAARAAEWVSSEKSVEEVSREILTGVKESDEEADAGECPSSSTSASASVLVCARDRAERHARAQARCWFRARDRQESRRSCRRSTSVVVGFLDSRRSTKPVVPPGWIRRRPPRVPNSSSRSRAISSTSCARA
jgi:hypothetical protein